MEVLESLSVSDGRVTRTVELVKADLTNADDGSEHDILVVSAFPGDYTPTPHSVIGALFERGISVDELARDKAVDLRATSSSWLSHEIRHRPAGVTFKRILCFEPSEPAQGPMLVGDIFRALVPVLRPADPDVVIAMPLVTAGDIGNEADVVVRALLDAATHWLAIGLPVRTLRLFVRSDQSAEMARRAFARWNEEHDAPANPPPLQSNDVFISYSHANRGDADFLIEELQRRGLSLFVDRLDLDPGMAWQQEIFEALDTSQRVVTLYSPEYLQSQMCQEEWNIARFRERKDGGPRLFPILLRSVKLPSYMAVVHYEDCREADRDRLRTACDLIALQLESEPKS